MREPTAAQLRSLYRLCHLLTNVMFQPIHIVRLDERTLNLFILAGQGEGLSLRFNRMGELNHDKSQLYDYERSRTKALHSYSS